MTAKIEVISDDLVEAKEIDIYGFAVDIEGLGLATDEHNGSVIVIDKFYNELVLFVYADINQECPTHIIGLQNAKKENYDENRKFGEEEICHEYCFQELKSEWLKSDD